jgi:hypothetical protein
MKTHVSVNNEYNKIVYTLMRGERLIERHACDVEQVGHVLRCLALDE